MSEVLYEVMVFGKSGCPKCKVLNHRVDALLEKPEWSAFRKSYQSLDTEEGLVAFCKAECVNPQRIPALVVVRRPADTGCVEYVKRSRPGQAAQALGASALYHIVGLQTDYSSEGRGVVSPAMIRAMLEEARAP